MIHNKHHLPARNNPTSWNGNPTHRLKPWTRHQGRPTRRTNHRPRSLNFGSQGPPPRQSNWPHGCKVPTSRQRKVHSAATKQREVRTKIKIAPQTSSGEDKEINLVFPDLKLKIKINSTKGQL